MESIRNVTPNEVLGVSEERDKSNEKKASKVGSNAVAGIFFGVSGLAGLLAGLLSWRAEEKKHSKFMAELKKNNLLAAQNRRNEGIILAFKALGWGTLYAVLGCSITTFIIWRIIKTKYVQDYLAEKKQKALLASANERTDFESWNDLMKYLLEKYEDEKKAKKV